MMKDKSINWFEGKLSQVISKNPNISDINDIAILALRKQRHSDLNEFYLDVAITTMKAEKRLSFKKVVGNANSISLAA